MLLLVLCAVFSPVFADVTVTETGQGITRDLALRDAMRRALEAGAGVELFNESRTENFELVRDTIFTRADGLVRDREILEEGEGAGGIYYVKIRALVSKDRIAREWGEVQNLLHQRGNPKIAVFVAETIDGALSTSSILESRFEKKLISVGFKVYAKDGLDEIKRRQVNDASRKGNNSKAQALAKQFGASIYVVGYSNANQAEFKLIQGVPISFYNCDVQAKIYYTDTAKLLASAPIPVVRGGARGENRFSPQAGKKAIDNAAEPLVTELYDMVMKSWSSEITFGGQIELVVKGISAGGSLRLKLKLADIPGIKTVNVQRGEDMATFDMRATITGEDLGMHLVQGDWPTSIAIEDFSLNKVEAKWIGP